MKLKASKKRKLKLYEQIMDESNMENMLKAINFLGHFADYLRKCPSSQHTMPGIPEENVVAEKRNRTLIYVIRSMIST